MSGCKSEKSSKSEEVSQPEMVSETRPVYKNIFSNVLDACEHLNIYKMNRREIAQELEEYASEVVGKEIPIRENNLSQGLEIESVVVDRWNATRDGVNFVIEFVTSDPNGIAKRLQQSRNVFVFFFLCTEDGKIIDSGVASNLQDRNRLRAPLTMRHDKIKYWRELNYIKMVDEKEHKIRETRKRGYY